MERKMKKKDIDEGPRPKSIINYGAVSSGILEDARFIRERETWKKPSTETAMSSTFDALIRMEAGVDGRTLAEKIADPNRPTWDKYKKDNEDKVCTSLFPCEFDC